MSDITRPLGISIVTPEGTYVAITDGHAVGYRFEQEGYEPQYIFLNPSGDSDDGQPNVFVYLGDDEDISNYSGGEHFYDIGVPIDEDHTNMLADLESEQCAVINYDGKVSFCGKNLGRFNEYDEMMAAIKQAMEDQKFWPNIYSINDHGNVSLLDNDGNEIKGWV